MANLTKEQIIKINEGCKNGFILDTQYFIFHNEKILEKIIELDEENYLKVHISFYTNWENYRGDGYYINVNISKFYHKKDDYFSSSSGLGINLKLNGKIYTRRNFKELQKATENITDDLILDIYNNDKNGKKQLDNPYVF